MTEQPKNPMAVFREQLYAPHQLEEFRAILPPGITAEMFARVVITAVNEKADLLFYDRRSLFNALMKAAKDGLLPDSREGWILPYKENFQTQDGWKTRILARWTRSPIGERKLIWDKSRLRLDVKVVYPGDEFDYEEGDNPRIIHKPKSNGSGRSDDITAVYSIARDETGRIVGRDVMWKAEIDQIRAIAKAQGGPWSNPTFYPEMAMKTVIHHHCKSLPTSHEVQFEPTELGRPEQVRTSAAAEPIQELLPSPDIFPQAMPGEPLHVPERSVENALDALAGKEPVGMAVPGAQEGAKPKRTRRTKEQIEADNAAIAKAQADLAAKTASGGGAGGQAAPDPFSDPASGSSTTMAAGFGGSGPGSDRVVILDDQNRPYYADTGEYLETSQDYDHESQEAKGSQAVHQQEEKPAAQVAQNTQGTPGNSAAPPANTNVNTAPKNGGPAGQLSADEQETNAFLREMSDSLKGRPLAGKQQYLDFLERWLERAGDNGNRFRAVRSFVGATSSGQEHGVQAHEIRAVADKVQAARKRGN